MIIAGTGHRTTDGEELMAMRGAAHTFLIEACPSHVISGMALGFDQVLATEARNLGIPWTAAIPFPGQHLSWRQGDQDSYHSLLESASDIVIVSPSYQGPWTFQVRNEWMVDRCELLVAYWRGTPGGTANCLKYAARVGREVRYLVRQ